MRLPVESCPKTGCKLRPGVKTVQGVTVLGLGAVAVLTYHGRGCFHAGSILHTTRGQAGAAAQPTSTGPKSRPAARLSGWVGKRGIISQPATVATNRTGPQGPSFSMSSCRKADMGCCVDTAERGREGELSAMHTKPVHALGVSCPLQCCTHTDHKADDCMCLSARVGQTCALRSEVPMMPMQECHTMVTAVLCSSSLSVREACAVQTCHLPGCWQAACQTACPGRLTRKDLKASMGSGVSAALLPPGMASCRQIADTRIARSPLLAS